MSDGADQTWAIMRADDYECGGWLEGIVRGDAVKVKDHLLECARNYAATFSTESCPEK